MTPRISRRSRGYTLVEMLIVMAIMIMLVAITLPTIRNVMEDGKTREASRQFNAYLAMAKARALQTGRPCGVMMICEQALGILDPAPPSLTTLPQWPARIVSKMYLAEVPPPYSGQTLGARGRIMYSVQVPGTLCFYPLLNGAPDGTPLAPPGEFATIAALLQPNELFLVRFDNKGAWYLCQFTSPSTSGALPEFVYLGKTSAGFIAPYPPGFIPNASNIPVPVPGLAGYTYQIIRMPRRIGNPLELPTGTCIDFAYSGIGPTDLPSNSLFYGMYPDPSDPNLPNILPRLFPANPRTLQSIALMFTPGGGIDSVYLNNWFFTPPTTVHFLIGRTDKISLPNASSAVSPTGLSMFDPATSNLLDTQSLWVSISRSTGNVVTSDNLPPPITSASSATMTILTTPPQVLTPNNSFDQATFLSYCRQLATNRDQAKTQ